MKKVLYFLLVVCAPIKAPNVIDHLAAAFQDISAQKSEKDGYLLLGPQLVGKKYNNENIIIDSDEKRKIYQIRVIDQTSIKGGSMQCGFQSQRNILYIADMIRSPFKDFDSLYGQMLKEKRFLDWNQAVSEIIGCDIKQLGNTITKKELPEISKKAPDSFPKNMVNANIIEFDFYYGDEIIMEQLKIYEHYIEKYEKLSKKEEVGKKARLARAYIQNNRKGRLFVEESLPIKFKNYIILIQMSVYTFMGHAVSLVIHKYNDTYEFLFADSSGNAKFSKSWSKIPIDTIVDFFMLSEEEFNEVKMRSRCLHYFWVIQSKLSELDKGGLSPKNFTRILFSVPSNTISFLSKMTVSDKLFYEKYYVNAMKENMKKFYSNYGKELEKQVKEINEIDTSKKFETFENYLKELGIS